MANLPKIPVTVILLTWNEARNLPRCLGALQDFAEIVVVDSGSTDGSRAWVAEHFPRVRWLENPFEDFGQQRNWALDHGQASHEWILFVDADEFMEPPLAEEIRDWIATEPSEVGAFIAGRNYFLGSWLKYSTFYPSFQLRLLRKGKVRYQKEGHGQREVADGKLVYLRHSWYHDAFSHGIEQWIARHNRYSSEEVALIHRLRCEPLLLRGLVSKDRICRRRCLKRLAARVPARNWVRWWYTYIWKWGFLDGRAGWLFSWLRFAHETHIVIKLAESGQSNSKGPDGKVSNPIGRSES